MRHPSLSITLTISLYASYHTCLSFLQPLHLSVFQNTIVYFSNCSYESLAFKLPLSRFITISDVSLSTTTVSLYNYLCLSFKLPLSLYLFTLVSFSNYLCLSFKLPLSLYLPITVSPSNYRCPSINVADHLSS